MPLAGLGRATISVHGAAIFRAIRTIERVPEPRIIMRRLFTAAVIAALALPAVAAAQEGNALALDAAAPAPAAVAGTLAPMAPTAAAPAAMVRADVAGIQQHENAADAHAVNTVAASSGLHQGQGVALMVVGGAAMLGGLIIGGDGGTAIAVGGLAVGLVGLYQYVR